MEVPGRYQGAQDREGMVHDDIRRAPVHQLGKLFEVQKVEGLRDRVIQKRPDRRQAACICHGSQGTGVALVGIHRRGREQGPVELPDIRVRVLLLLPKGLQGVVAGQVPVVVLLVQVREKLSQQLLATVEQGDAPESCDVSSRSCPGSIQPCLVHRVVGASGLVGTVLECCLRQGGDLHSSRGGRG
jgi:hypothetical protein